MPRPLFTPGKDPVPIVQKTGWAPGPVWTGVENLASTEVRSPDRPARSQSLYRLRYPAHKLMMMMMMMMIIIIIIIIIIINAVPSTTNSPIFSIYFSALNAFH